MHNDSVDRFADNWAYLRTELTWLDRVLSLAVAKQRKDSKEIDRVARTRVDLVTSHWWKGLISLDEDISYDSPAEMPRHRTSKTAASFQQHLAARILASQQQGIVLGIPSLCTRLHLSLFEKNLVLMALAPEINRRYGRLYNYLQETEQPGASGLPSVDLILRILCRNDAEWKTARLSLSLNSTLVHYGLIKFQIEQPQPLLTRLVKLSDPLVDYLLTDEPSSEALERLLQSPIAHPQTSVHLQSGASALLQSRSSSKADDLWSSLVLPDFLVLSLQHLCQRMQYAAQVDALWQSQIAANRASSLPGAIALLTGMTGTGKTTAARAIAQTLQTPLYYADLKLIAPSHSLQLLDEIANQSPRVLLLKSAQFWLGRSATLPPEHLHTFFEQRRCNRSITLFIVEQVQMVKPAWKQEMQQVLEFPNPNQQSRLRIWQQIFPAEVDLDTAIDWEQLARLPVTGGQIQAIAREATLDAIAESSPAKVSMKHLLQAYATLYKKRLKGQKPL